MRLDCRKRNMQYAIGNFTNYGKKPSVLISNSQHFRRWLRHRSELPLGFLPLNKNRWKVSRWRNSKSDKTTAICRWNSVWQCILLPIIINTSAITTAYSYILSRRWWVNTIRYFRLSRSPKKKFLSFQRQRHHDQGTDSPFLAQEEGHYFHWSSRNWYGKAKKGCDDLMRIPCFKNSIYRWMEMQTVYQSKNLA